MMSKPAVHAKLGAACMAKEMFDYRKNHMGE